jgi:protein-disulfide isomerase
MSTTHSTPRWAGTAARIGLGAVWAWAAVTTLTDTAASVRTGRPAWLVQVLTHGLPVLEIGLAVLLLLGLSRRLTEGIGSVLLVLLLADLVAAGVQAGWGSPGAPAASVHIGPILRDAGLLAVCVFSMWTDRVWTDRVWTDRVWTDRVWTDRVWTDRAAPDPTTPADPAHLYRLLGRHADWTRRRDERRRQRVAVLTGVALIAAATTGLELRAALDRPEPPTPVIASLADGITLGRADAPVRLDLWEDLRAEPCRRLDTQLGPQVSRWVDTGLVRVHFHVVALLDADSDYSARAANALYAAGTPAAFLALRRLLYAATPRPDSPAPTNDDLVRLAGQAGSPSVGDAVRTGLYDEYVARATDRAVRDGVTGAPAVRVDGVLVADPTPGAVAAAVAAAGR